jgi:hypothetical protein
VLGEDAGMPQPGSHRGCGVSRPPSRTEPCQDHKEASAEVGTRRPPRKVRHAGRSDMRCCSSTPPMPTSPPKLVDDHL